MALKDKVLTILEDNRGKSVSGNKIANSLGLTRSAVWKAVKQLRDEGYSISAVTNRGYCLTSDNDLLNEPAIFYDLTTKSLGRKLDVFKTIDSTNSFAKSLAQLGAAHGHVVVAETQTDGKGRQGKSFYSPNNHGVYFSVIVRPQLSIDKSSLIISCTAVAVAEAIERLSGLECGIKWVNDIYCGGKKLCGILTEASVGVEQGGLDFAVIGIGVNITNLSFPDELEGIAGSIKEMSGKNIGRGRLIAEILNCLEQRLDNITSPELMESYRKRSILIGKRIRIENEMGGEIVECVNIDDVGALVIRDSSGNERTLTTGSVSLC